MGAVGPVGATTTVGPTVVGVADGLSATRPGPSGRGPLPAAPRSAPGSRSSTAATRPARTASCRSAAGRNAAARSTTSSTRRAPWPRPGIARSPARPERELVRARFEPDPRFAHVDPERWAGRRLDLHGRPDLAELIRAIDGLRTADGHPAIPRLRFVTSHPWDLSDRLITALADCPSVCEHLHLPSSPATTRSFADRPAVHDRALPRAAGPDPRGRTRDHDLDRHHRRLLWRDRGAIPSNAGAAGDRALRPGVRRGVLAAAGHARDCSPTTSRPIPSDAGSTSCSPSRRRSAWNATRRGSAGSSRSSSTRWHRHAPTPTATSPPTCHGSPAVLAATSSFTWWAAPTWSVGRSRCGSGTPGRTPFVDSISPSGCADALTAGREYQYRGHLRRGSATEPPDEGACTPTDLSRGRGGEHRHGLPRYDRVRRSTTPRQLDVVESFARGRLSRREFIKRRTVFGLAGLRIGDLIAWAPHRATQLRGPPQEGPGHPPALAAASLGDTARSGRLQRPVVARPVAVRDPRLWPPRPVVRAPGRARPGVRGASHRVSRP